MKVPKVLFKDNSLPAEIIYGRMFDRIQDLNRTAFQYRFIYLALLAGYYTSLSFVDGIAEESRFFTGPVAHELIIVTLTVATLVGVICIYFFECMNQELIEHCVSSIRNIEYNKDVTVEFRIFSHPASAIMSYRFAVIITLLYFVPAAGLLLYLNHFVSSISLALDSTPFMISRSEFCSFGFDAAVAADKIMDEVQTVVDLPKLVFSKMYEGLCIGSTVYDEGLFKSVLYGYTVALAFSVLFVVITVQRLVGRMLVVARLNDPFNPSNLNKALKKSVDVLAMVSTISITIFFMVIFLGVYFEWERAYRFITFWLLDREQPKFELIFPTG